MTWFFLALIATLGWGFADLFYKKGTDEDDRYSHLKIAVNVGTVMMITSVLLLIFSKESYTIGDLLQKTVKYSPASLGYIISMVVGYAGLRYLEVSIISPVQNASGAFSAMAMIVFLLIKGKISTLGEELSVLEIIGSLIIVAGVIALAVVENKISSGEKIDKKHRMGALALVFPLLYCVFDTLGTAADGIILDERNGMDISETDVLIIYGFAFFIAGIIAYIFLLLKTKKFYNPFEKNEIKNKGVAALCEEFGQIFYVYAMAEKPVLAAPMIASYCIVSVLLSRIFLKEQLKKSQMFCVCTVIVGIVILGICDGISEL